MGLVCSGEITHRWDHRVRRKGEGVKMATACASPLCDLVGEPGFFSLYALLSEYEAKYCRLTRKSSSTNIGAA
jgi:hypothetical protein